MNPIKRWTEDAKKQPDVRHVDTCDGVRALAIMIVVWYHIWQQSWLYPEMRIFGKSISFDPLVRSGYIWVDIMILISGFCLYLPWGAARAGGEGAKPARLLSAAFDSHPSLVSADACDYVRRGVGNGRLRK